jgi:hypothetical protein
MITFKNPTITLEPILTKGEVRTIEFEFEGDENLIQSISPSCGCTADCKWQNTGNKVICKFTESDGAKQDPKNYPTGLFNFSKSINVFLKSEQDIWVVEGLNKKLLNDKKHVKLTFKGQVKL